MKDIQPLDREILKKIYISKFDRKCERVLEDYPLNLIRRNILEKHLKKLQDKGYIDKSCGLTEKGRKSLKIGLLGGAFDIVHVGHIETIKEAKKYVDILAVVVARDKTVYRNKGRYPINNEVMRLKVIRELKDVDIAILGDEKDFMKPVLKIEPDIIFLGYDQNIPEELIDKLKGKYSVIRLTSEIKGIKTTYIIRRLREIFQI